MNQIGTVEIQGPRTYALDAASEDQMSRAVVDSGTYPVYCDGLSYFWVMTGVLNVGGLHSVGDGMFIATPGDMLSEIPVQFPSKMFGEDEFKELLDLPVSDPDSIEHRLTFVLDPVIA